MPTQECSTTDCGRPAAFATRSEPAWCLDCIDNLVRAGGLEPAEPFTKPSTWRLTTCRTCGVQAHYRLEYIIGNNAAGIATCRACHWKAWRGNRGPRPGATLDRGKITRRLDEFGYELIDPLDEVSDDGDGPLVAKCRRCGRIRAARMGDFGWRCNCSRNTRSSNPASPRPGRLLLSESDSPALQWWDHERNDEATFRTVTVRATRACQWRCPECGRRFEAKVSAMAERPTCPDCSARRHAEWKSEYAQWQTTPVAEVPELAAAWADDADPREVMVAGSWKLRRFRCPNGHQPRISPLTFMSSGCPHCRGAKTAAAKKWLADTSPEIAGQWHPTLNGKHSPQNVVWDSQRMVWWRADCCGHEWQDTVRARDKYQRLRCPACRTFLGSLAWDDPGLAAEWSPANPLTAWNVRPHTSTPFVPEWICATNPGHTWQAPLSSRSNGAECPDCREAGKSRVELAHHAAAEELFGNARSGVAMKDKAFTTRKSWTTDISVSVNEHTLVIEYDGAYWHSAPAKVLVDERKSRDLLAAGCLVVRLREDDLPTLGIDHPRYREVRAHSTVARPGPVMEDIRDWVTDLTA
ncbi:conserved hypothetical protein (plasmid) [Rhodococcus jostii RHA1]|uniref:Treble clef zinc finger domain-containing protein n=1 Tax=Rhodococcus jostii (strain RHA1) TaxID=101510 RepID=Q0RVQ4_RHOJR|nr:zinc-ribbon domain-containing protein [Rhodococcus jostii]ABH00632.1 conserved hypothetical protein [Rhodococcus jostii RHA1]